jgi:hypothetical protein
MNQMERSNRTLSNVGNILLIGGASVAALSLVPVLLGFGSLGVAGGSIAAGIQSSIGSVAAGSWFATLTSYGMTGAFTGIAVKGLLVSGVGAGIRLNEENNN